MSNCFYDKVAKKFGSYKTDAKRTSIYQDRDPEELFKQKLLGLSGQNKLALDVGCADGRFTLSVAEHFSKIIAIDISRGMLEAARRFQQKAGVTNVDFRKQDVRTLPYEDGYFDIVFNRRGPPDFPQFFRVLKKGSYYLEIRIGEKDCKELKQVFSRGQGYDEWDKSALKKDSEALKKVGFQVIYGQNFHYQEFYPTFEDLDLFLQAVPIFEDYDPKKDKERLTTYIRNNQSDKGVLLNRHRVVTLSRKN